ncbi:MULTISPECIES: hypothetical protein [unclassified Streptomyces]|uniref:hypothetical protein n=2 Tax=Streptomyces TaxID=1883 RepID=UPI002252EAF6|nr:MULTISPECIES: hypothetical protein [unclassified Streptomyces]MCX4792440.1 hypothetical protein [Streptomyces sp. NBC_01221]MCX4799791.1 hypothetical protein [Streptomyces sp. NBC_01242]WSP67757.1 hypothetical protein OG466_39910 [Streptomyces sp. NBC_01240]WSU26804.1 hypothetical protein OG508_39470 [Streptomyces sp. NBC_01108]
MPSGHTQQDTAQARPAGPRLLAPIPFEVESVLPELAEMARAVTLLYPRAGHPGPGDSSIGGPLLWPTGEPWPMCAEPDHYKPLGAPVGPEPVAMVPVVQLYARDVPGLVFPDGTDLLQILWCPLVHEDDQYAANPRLHWRSTALTAADAAAGRPPRPHTAEEDYLPRPCTVSPTPAVEYPNWDLPEGLSELLDERFEALQKERGFDYFEVATTQQSKVGGYPGWTQPPDWPDCAGCGTRMEHLLSVTATEPGMGRWLPLDDRNPRQNQAALPSWRAEADPAALDAFGHDMGLGDIGGMYFFVCRTCPDTPYTHRYDC